MLRPFTALHETHSFFRSFTINAQMQEIKMSKLMVVFAEDLLTKMHLVPNGMNNSNISFQS